MNTNTVIEKEIEFTRVNNDVNGNPRWVCHFLELLSTEDKYVIRNISTTPIEAMYQVALHKAKKIGGKRFHNKQYGGGIVFQSYSLPELTRLINEAKNS